MKIIVVDKSSSRSLVLENTQTLPRMGEAVNMGYKPYPYVIDVLWKPPVVEGVNYDVLVFVE